MKVRCALAQTNLLTLLLSLSFLGSHFLLADEIKMKDGTTHTGRITYEGDDIVKIEIPVTASIKETKILSRNDILNITKMDCPRECRFEPQEIQNMNYCT